MRFTTRVLVTQLITVCAVVAIAAAIFVALAVQQLRSEAETSALNIARTIAEDPEVRQGVADEVADPAPPDGVTLADGPLQALALRVAERTGTLFVVITDDAGIRLAHPDPALLAQQVSTDWREVLAGREIVSWEEGTLGVSARAKVPVYGPDGSAPIGEVSVGFEPASVFDELPTLLLGIAGAAAAAIAIGAGAALWLRRRWERMTLGLQPEQLVTLVQQQAAVLDGVGDGVIALDPQGVVQVCNRAAERMLGVRSPVGKPLSALGLGLSVVDALASGSARDGVVVGQRVLYIDSRPVTYDGRALGDVLVVRDRTDVVALSERLDTVRTMTGALRVQRHEFANRLHVAAGLIDAGRATDAREFLGDQLQRGPVDYPVAHLDLLTDSFLQSFVGAKALEAGERGVAISLADDTLLTSTVTQAEDAAAVLGNLLDNAVSAAVAGESPRWVEVGCYGDANDLVLTVADSGSGIDADTDVFERRPRDPDADATHGWGVGLPLAREVARRRGGDVWLIDRGNPGGAVFGARLVGVLGGTVEPGAPSPAPRETRTP